MSQGLINTKRRIQSISSTKKITKAMELVATVKLKKWKDGMENVISYLNNMNDIIANCASSDNDLDLLEFKNFKDANSTLYIIVTSSLGLCGGYNYNVFKLLNSNIKENDKVLVFGTKGLAKLNNENIDNIDDYVSYLDKFDYSKVANLVNIIKDEYGSGKYKSVKLISTVYVNSLTFTPTIFDIFPLTNLKNEDNNKDIIFEPNKEEVLKLLLPKYINTFIYARLVEAIVCEQASRRNAMDNANDNAEELLEKLNIEYNKARQAAITQEITEVVAGANNV